MRRLAVAAFAAAALLSACGLTLGLDGYRDCSEVACDASGRPDARDAFVEGDVVTDVDAAPQCDAANGDQNCGRCGHSCLGGKCVAGRCTPTALYASHGSRALAADENYVYAAASLGRVEFCMLPECGVPTTMTQHPGATITSFAQSVNRLYFTDYSFDDGGSAVGAVESAEKGTFGLAPTVITSSPNRPDSLVPCGASLCWVDPNTSLSYVLSSGSGGGAGKPSLRAMVPGPLSNVGFAWDGTRTWFTDGQWLLVEDGDGGPGTPVIQRGNVVDLVYQNGTFYWVEQGSSGDAAVVSCSAKDCAGTAKLLVDMKGSILGRIAVDDTDVYFTVTESPNGKVLKCARAGCNSIPTVVADQQLSPWALAANSTRVFWSNDDANLGDGQIVWVAK